MTLPFSRNKNSLRRMKAGLNRLVSTIETMKENLNKQEEEYEYVWEYEDDDSEDGLEEDEVPEEVVADLRREEATVAAEQAHLAQWRSELEAILKDRAERRHYFKDFANESQQRYERMLQSARDQQSPNKTGS
jgi:S-DNA-T family DNA segregation ATPase FtsK/SpoIIIE